MVKREICIQGKCFDTNIDVENKEIRFVSKEGSKECSLEEIRAFKQLYKDPETKMKLIEKVSKAESEQKP